ncbi:MAG: hypothetical protein M0R80_02305 [Proteobacteria bacterium]|jgi:hypothetical protein|nr:hypothetical protein [Pseudomonadota bacterium]
MAMDFSGIKKEAGRLASGGGFGQNLVKMPDGKGVLVLRLLSNPKFNAVSGGVFVRTRIHMINGKNIHCPRELGDDGYWRGPCPICEYYSLLWKTLKNKSPEEQEHDKAVARAIKPIERYYYNVIVRQEQDQETGAMLTNVGPKIFGCGKTLHEIIIEKLSESCDVTDPQNGMDFRVVKNIKKGPDGEYPDYVKSKFEEPSVAGTPEEVAKWAASLHNLCDLRKLLPYEELLFNLRVHFGMEKDNSVGFDVREFANATATTTVGTTAVAKPTVTTEEPEMPVTVGGGDQQLADDEFAAGLENL